MSSLCDTIKPVDHKSYIFMDQQHRTGVQEFMSFLFPVEMSKEQLVQ